MIFRISLTLLMVCVAGCSPHKDAEALLDDYLKRLERVSGLEIAPVEPAERPGYPPRRLLLHSIEPPDIGWTELWGYRHCGLSELLGERNSVLGKHMQDSTHFVMDARIIERLRACLELIDDDEQKALTRSLLTIKISQLPYRFSNATVASTEMQTFWSYSALPLQPDSAGISAALEALGVWASTGQMAEFSTPELVVLESQNSVLRQRGGGRTVKALLMVREKLEAANTWLASAASSRRFCPYNHPTEELEWARNVMRKVFIGEVQPYIAQLNNSSLQLLEEFFELVEIQPTETQEALADFGQRLNQTQQDFVSATKKHVALWQEVFNSCHSSPRTQERTHD